MGEEAPPCLPCDRSRVRCERPDTSCGVATSVNPCDACAALTEVARAMARAAEAGTFTVGGAGCPA